MIHHCTVAGAFSGEKLSLGGSRREKNFMVILPRFSAAGADAGDAAGACACAKDAVANPATRTPVAIATFLKILQPFLFDAEEIEGCMQMVICSPSNESYKILQIFLILADPL